MAYRKSTDDAVAEPNPTDSVAGSSPAPDSAERPRSERAVADGASSRLGSRPGASAQGTDADAATGASDTDQPVAGAASGADDRAGRTLEVENLVKNHVIVALSLGLVPLPLFDLALLTGNSVVMVRSLSQLYEVPFEEHRVQAIVVSLVGGALPVLGVVSLSAGAKLLPGIGTLFGSGTVAVTGGALTYAIGQVFIRHFEAGGTLLDFDAAKLRERFRREVTNGKAAVAEVREQMTNGPVKP